MMPLFDRLTTVLLVFAVGYVLFGPQKSRSGSESISTGVGKSAPTIENHVFTQSETLVMSVRSTCRFCTNSMPFYRQLLENRKRMGASLKVVVVSPEPREVTEAYLAQNGVSADLVAQVNAETWRDYLRTPTLLHVDPKGVISDQWTGQLAPDAEKRVLTALHLYQNAYWPFS